MPSVNPEILRWARETADLSVEEAALAIGLNDAYGHSGAERLASLEVGEGEPSRSLLLKMSHKYRRPLLVFYLKEPPRKGGRGKDFRTLPGARPLPYDPVLDALIRDIKSRQSLIRSLIEDEESPPLSFVASFDIKSGSPALTEQITKVLSFSLSDFRKQRDFESAFKYLRSQMEAAGIFVMLAGNLGSFHSNISADTFRGFAIADNLAPFIVINDQDAHSAWSFTALHEAAHLWLGDTGVSGANYLDTRIEQFCNNVASEMLLPSSELQEIAHVRSSSFEDAVAQISEFAGQRNISRAMVAYRLFRSEIIVENTWRSLNSRFQQEWQESRKKNNEIAGNSSHGPSYYVVRRHRLGQAILAVVGRSLTEGVISYTKAAQVLGVKPSNVKPLLRGVPYQGGA